MTEAVQSVDSVVLLWTTRVVTATSENSATSVPRSQTPTGIAMTTIVTEALLAYSYQR